MNTKLTKTYNYFNYLINIKIFSKLFSIYNFKFTLFTLKKYLQISLSIINTIKLHFLKLNKTI